MPNGRGSFTGYSVPTPTTRRTGAEMGDRDSVRINNTLGAWRREVPACRADDDVPKVRVSLAAASAGYEKSRELLGEDHSRTKSWLTELEAKRRLLEELA